MGPPLLSTILKAREDEEAEKLKTCISSETQLASAAQEGTSRTDRASLRHNLDLLESSRQASSSLSAAFQRLQVLHATLLELQRSTSSSQNLPPQLPPLPPPPDRYSMGPGHQALVLSANEDSSRSNSAPLNDDSWYAGTLRDVLRDDGVAARLQSLRAESLNLPSVSNINLRDNSVNNTTQDQGFDWMTDMLTADRLTRRSSPSPSESDSEQDILQQQSRDHWPRINISTTGRAQTRLSRRIPVYTDRVNNGREGETLLGRRVTARQANHSSNVFTPRDSVSDWMRFGERSAPSSARSLAREHNSNSSRSSVTLRTTQSPHILPHPPANLESIDWSTVYNGRVRTHDNDSDRSYVVRRRLNRENIEEVTHIPMDAFGFDSPFASSQVEHDVDESHNSNWGSLPDDLRVSIPQGRRFDGFHGSPTRENPQIDSRLAASSLTEGGPPLSAENLNA